MNLLSFTFIGKKSLHLWESIIKLLAIKCCMETGVGTVVHTLNLSDEMINKSDMKL